VTTKRTGGRKLFADQPARINLRNEFSSFERSQGAVTDAQFGWVQSPLAKEPAKELVRGAILLLRVAIITTRHEVAVGITVEFGAGHDMVQALPAPCCAPQTIEAPPAFSLMDGPAQRRVLQEVPCLKVYDAGNSWLLRNFGHLHAVNFLRQSHSYHVTTVTAFAAFDQTQGAVVEEPVQRWARGPDAKTRSVSEPRKGKTDLRFAFEPAMSKEMRIHRAVYR